MRDIFFPQLLTTLRHYTLTQLYGDLSAGVIVGIIAFPLAIALGIASGVTPQEGLVTAVIAGALIALLGGSRVQISGPTGAFVVIVYGIVLEFGLPGLIIATFIAGILLIIMGLLRLGEWIKFVPLPVIIGFTSGIAVVIATLQIRDFLGLPIEALPAGFLKQWRTYWPVLNAINAYSVAITLATVAIISFCIRFLARIPGGVIAIFVTTAAVHLLHFPVETVGSKFGVICCTFSTPHLPALSWELIVELFPSGFTIAVLCAIESLLCAVIADTMLGTKHRSNTELIAQGIANLIVPLFGGIPSTGAIARTAANVRNGATTPIAGLIHAATLFLILLFFSAYASLVPMATIAGIMLVVAYNMSEWREFSSLLNAPRADVAVLLITFCLTVLFDIVIAIQGGVILSAFLFMNRMADVSEIQRDIPNNQILDTTQIPPDVEVLTLSGAFFFAAASKFEQILLNPDLRSKEVILRMGKVTMLDATALRILERLAKHAKKAGRKLVIAEAKDPLQKIIRRSLEFRHNPKTRFFATLEEALRFIA